MSVVTRPISTLPPGTAFTRYLVAKYIASQQDKSSAIASAQAWTDTPHVAACLQAEFFPQIKAAVNPGTIAEPAWAAPLAQYRISSEALTLERGLSVIGRLSDRFRRVPFRVSIPRELGAGTGGAWVGEGAPAAPAQSAFNSVTQQIYKAQTLVAVSRELLKLGDPSTEATLRTTIIAGLAEYLDKQFLTASVTAVGGLRPAAITNAATAITSTGGTAAQIIADLAALIQAITTPAESLVWVMKPQTAFTIAARLANVGMTTDIPQTLLGIPMVLSANSPQQITLVDASQILYSDEDGFAVDISDQATIEMESPATSPPTASTITVSLFQENLTAFKVTRWLAYQRARDASVAYMATTY